MPITKHYMGYYSPDEYTYECDACGHTIEEDDVIEIKGEVFCKDCAKERTEVNEMNYKDIDIAYDEDMILYNEIKTFGNKNYRFVYKDLNTINGDVNLISCDLGKSLTGDECIRIVVQCWGVNRYAIIEQFHEGRWLTKIFKIDEKGNLLNYEKK